MINRISAAEFLDLGEKFPVVDVRSENEYLQGHIPGGLNLPLFDNEERAIIGTLYKNSGRETSVLKGLELAGPKLAGLIKELHKFTDQKKVLVHCWRGGMRSESMAWLFHIAGYEVSVLEGGYKFYQRYIREQLTNPANIIVLGGLTGSGKTEILRQLETMGQQVLDLEEIACHKGSVFGGLGMNGQPTNEQFENDLFSTWEKLDPSLPVWIEDESRMIGNVSIPDPLFEQMSRSVMIKVECGREQRIQRLVHEYAGIEKEDLKKAIVKIGEKLGGANTHKALAAIDSGDFYSVADLALSYYDKSYSHSVLKRSNQEIHTLPVEDNDPLGNARMILKKAESLNFIKLEP